MIWMAETVVLAVHEAQIASHGGVPGIRDIGLVRSALARPTNLLAYGEPDLPDLAAAYAYGLVKAHGFVDGNKRVSLVVTETFLALNGQRLVAEDASCFTTWMGLADGSLSEAGLALWIRSNMEPR